MVPGGGLAKSARGKADHGGPAGGRRLKRERHYKHGHYGKPDPRRFRGDA